MKHLQNAVELASTGPSSRLVLLKFLATRVPLHFMFALLLYHLYQVSMILLRTSQTTNPIDDICKMRVLCSDLGHTTQSMRPVSYHSRINDRLLWLRRLDLGRYPWVRWR